MNPFNANGTGLGAILNKLSAQNFRFGFERQFNQIQNTSIRRINSEIDTIIKNDDTPRRLQELERDYQKLEKNKELIDSFAFDMRSNMLRLEEMKTHTSDAIAAFSADDDDTNLTADEVDTITAKRDELIEDTSALLLSIHPDVAQPYVIRDVKNMLSTLKGMEPVVGTVDAEGSGSPTNDNRQILDDLSTLSSLLDTAYNVTATTHDNASYISLDIAAASADKVADMTELSSVELKEREDQIADIKAKYSNILRVISISFEARIATLEKMSENLQGPNIEPGSVMNLFT